MKKVFAMAIFLLSFGAFSPETAQAQTKNSTQLSNQGQKIKVTMKFGRASRACKGFGFGCFEIGLEIELEFKSQLPIAEILVKDSKTLNLTFLSMGGDFNEDTSIFATEKDVLLDQKISSKLGFGERKVVIKAGEYKTSKNTEDKVVASVNYQVL